VGIAPKTVSRALVLSCAALAAPAAAQSTPFVDAAADDGSQAPNPRALFDRGSFAEAYEGFAAAYARSPDPHLLWNMAACEKNLHHYAKARAALRAYSSSASSASSPAVAARERKEAEDLIEKLASLVSKLRVTVSEPGAEVVVDGDSLGVSPLAPMELDVGAHEVLVRKPGFQDFQRSVHVARDVASAVDVRLVKASDAAWRAPLVQQSPQLNPSAQSWRMDRGSSFTLDITGGSGTPHAGSLVPSKASTGRSSSIGPLGGALVGLAAAAAIYRLTRGDASRDRAASSAQDHAAADPHPPSGEGDRDRASRAPEVSGLSALDVLK
jgi:hypothetical protein